MKRIGLPPVLIVIIVVVVKNRIIFAENSNELKKIVDLFMLDGIIIHNVKEAINNVKLRNQLSNIHFKYS